MMSLMLRRIVSPSAHLAAVTQQHSGSGILLASTDAKGAAPDAGGRGLLRGDEAAVAAAAAAAAEAAAVAEAVAAAGTGGRGGVGPEALAAAQAAAEAFAAAEEARALEEQAALLTAEANAVAAAAARAQRLTAVVSLPDVSADQLHVLRQGGTPRAPPPAAGADGGPWPRWAGGAAAPAPRHVSPRYAGASTYYSAHEGGKYQCRSLGQLDFRLHPDREPFAEDAQYRGAQLTFGSWRMKQPRFVAPEHAVWWQGYSVVMDRKKANCPGTTAHPWAPARPVSDLGTAAFYGAQYQAERAPHEGWMEFCEMAYTSGRVELWHNAIVSEAGPRKHSCGQDGKSADLLANASPRPPAYAPIAPAATFTNLVWGVIPAVPFVQHFVQNSLPKFAALGLVDPGLLPRALPAGMAGTTTPGTAYFDVTANQELLLDRFPLVAAFYDHLGWRPPVDKRNVSVAAGNLVYPCNLPPLHPLLWQLSSSLLLRLPPPKPLEERRKLVYCGRTRGGKIENAARRVLNEEALMGLLSGWATPTSAPGGTPHGGANVAAPLELVEFDHTAYDTIDKLVAFWSDVRALVGPHGGCLTNVIFMPCNSLVVELFPLVYARRAATTNAGAMMYMQSTFLEHEYWMVPTTTWMRNGDFRADLQSVCRILTLSLGAPPFLPAGYDCGTIPRESPAPRASPTVAVRK